MRAPLARLVLCAAFLSAPVFAASRLVNISVRSSAGSGADTLIVGFTISGTGTKQMLLRGIGPTLSTFGVSGVVADPELRLFNQSSASIATNDDWGGAAGIVTAGDAVGAFRLPANSRDAVLLTSVPAGSYSAHLVANSGTGIALVEGYDADAAASTAPARARC